MDFFVNLRHFYRKELFTDLVILVSNSRGSWRQVCLCHSLVIVSAIPQLKDVLSQNRIEGEDIHLVLDQADHDVILEAIDDLYDALAEGKTMPDSLEANLFNMMPLQKFHRKESRRSTKPVKKYRKSSDHYVKFEEDCTDEDDFKYDGHEEIEEPFEPVEAFTNLEDLVGCAVTQLDPLRSITASVIDESFLFNFPTLQTAQPSRIIPESNVVMLLAVGRRQGSLIANVIVANLNDASSITPSRICGGMLDMMSKVVGCSLATIFDSPKLNIDEDLMSDYDKAIYPKYSSGEQDTYFGIADHKKKAFVRTPLTEKEAAIRFVDKVLFLELLDFMVLTGENVNNLQLQPYLNMVEIATLSKSGQVDVFLEITSAFCGLASVKDLLKVLVMKAIAFAHCGQKFLRGKTDDDSEEIESQQDEIAKLESSSEYDSVAMPMPIKQEEESNLSKNEKNLSSQPRFHTWQGLTFKRLKKQTRIDYTNMVCDYDGCNKKFNTYEAWKAHTRSYHQKEGSGVACDSCGTMYQNFFFLKRHKRLSHDEVACKDCSLKFFGNNELSRHIRRDHLKGNEHICELCGAGFKVKTYLKRHLRQQHPGSVQSPFVCNECNKPFGTGRKLRDHNQVFHVKTRPHKCRAGDHVCDKSFTTISMRRRHEKQVHKLSIYTAPGSKSKFMVEHPTNDSTE